MNSSSRTPKLALSTLSLALALGACDLEPSTPDTDTTDDAQAAPAVIDGVEVFDMHSESVGDDFRVFVSMPQSRVPSLPVPEGERFPVIYVLDANWAIGNAIEFTRMHAGYSLPNAIVVGIGYPEDGAMDRLLLRTRDMTPSEDPLFAAVNDSEVQAVIDAGGQPVFDHYRMGGADAFLDFIATELQPLVEANYPADPDDATIVGASLGGTFATYALFERPELFERYVIVSPGLNWDDAMLMDLEAEYAANHEDLSARVFLAAGGLEELERATLASYGDEQYAELQLSYRMVERMQTLADTLEARAYPGLTVNARVIEGEHHTSTPGPAMSIGLRTVFDSMYFFTP